MQTARVVNQPGPSVAACRRRRLAFSVVGAASSAALSAQAAASAEPSLEEITVTGTRIQQDGITAPTPVTVVDAARLQDLGATNIGNLQRELGRIDDSAASLARAVELARRVLAPTDRARLNAEIELGMTSLVQGDSARALALARGVLAIVPEDQPTVLLAEGRFLLARALGRSSAEGREAARQSLAIYRGLGEGLAAEAGLVETWLASAERG